MMKVTKQGSTNMLFILAVLIILIVLSGAQVYAAVDEEESNDTKSNANVIKIGSYVYGSTDTNENNDWNVDDWFVFKPPVSGTVKIVLKEDADYDPDDSDFGLNAEILDSNSNRLISVYDNLSTDSGTSGTFGVRAGKTYYVKCYASFFSYAKDYHFRIEYSIGKTTITSVKGKKKKFTVKWNKKAKASFYQVQYVKKTVFDDYGWNKAKIVKVSKSKNVKTIKKLAKKKTYYVRVRVARIIAGKTYYSGWSKRKAVKIK